METEQKESEQIEQKRAICIGHGATKKQTPYNITSRAARGGGGSFKNRKRIGEIGCCESRMTQRKH